MLDFVVQCFAVSFSIAFGFVLIYGAVKGINRLFDGKRPACGITKVKHFIEEGNPVELKLSDGRIVSGDKFIGFTEFGDHKHAPDCFKQWVVLESENSRVFIKPEAIRLIKESKS